MYNLEFEFHPLQESDLPLLTKWLNRPHLQQWWRSEKLNPHEVREKYLPRIIQQDSARPFIAFLNDKAMGYIQYYSVSDGNPDWWPDEPGNGILGIDQFIAQENKLNQGYGTVMIKQFVDFLFKNPQINEIRVDPRPDNLRAIKCYEKVGFQIIQEINTPDGPALMMSLSRTDFY